MSSESSSLRSTRRAWAMISGPMPSPGRTAIFMAPRLSEIPGVLRFALRLEGADLVRVAQREADLVQAVEQAVLAERIDLEAHDLRFIQGRHHLPVQVY